MSVNLARGVQFYSSVLFQNMSTEHSGFIFLFLCFLDYVQVVDMGTLELRITAVKPGADGKMV